MNEIIKIAQDNRMRVTEQTKAIIDDTTGVFFCITEKSLVTFEGVEYPLEKITEVLYNTHTSTFYITYIDEIGSTNTLAIIPKKSIECEPILLSKLLPVIIPNIEKFAYFDIMRSRGMFNGQLWNMEDVFKPISDWDFERVYAMVVRAFKEWGFKKTISERLCQMGLDLFMCDHQRNLWLEWVQSIKWDGTKRLDTFFRDTIGASAPALQENGKEFLYISSVTRAFFYGAIQRAREETVMEVIPVLVSNKQGIGKSSLVRYIAGPNRDWYKVMDDEISDEKRFWENINGGKIIELSESEALKTTRVSKLKSFVSKSSDTFREAYARYSQTYDRHWVAIATSNEQKMFIDKTGNRRFFPMICDTSKITFKFFDEYRVRNFAYIEQVWAEAYYDFINDSAASCIIEPGSEIMELAGVMQESSSYVDDRYDAIDDFLDDPENDLVLQGSRISRSELIRCVFGENPSKPEKETTYTITRWAECTKKWKLIPITTYKGRTVRNLFERKADHLSIKEKFSDTEIIKRFHKFTETHGYEEMTPAHLDEFLKELGLPYNYMDSLTQMLLKESLIFDYNGVWYRY